MRIVLGFVFILSSHLLAQNYYDNINVSSSQLLRTSLHNLIDNHNVVSYESCKQHLQNTDSDPNNSGNIILIYKQNSVNESWDGGETWNREHVWAASLGLYDSDAYSDLHNLKPSDPSVNSSKGNKNFDNGGTQHDEALECFYTQNTWEPADNVKGDIARILFYMDIRYEGGADEPNLAVTEMLNSTSGVSNIGKLSTLLDWHIQDPVDDFEITRNEIIHDIQGNRNPFIDHPEYVSILWGNDGSLSNALRLRGVMDFDLSGSNGKSLHLYAQQDIPDLSIFGIGVANNGSGTDGQEEILPAMSVSEGDHILLARSPESIEFYLGDCYQNFDHVIQASDAISQNGDDAIEVYEQGVLIETFGDVNQDGTGQSWEYSDSWAYNFDGIWSYGLDCESVTSSITGTGSFSFNLSQFSMDESMDVYYHVPDGIDSKTPILIVLHGGGRNADDYRDAFIDKSNSLGFIVVAPEFSQASFPGGDSYNLGNIFIDGDNPTLETLNPENEWSFSIFDPLFTYVKDLTNNTSQTYDVFGNSAGGQVAHRLLLFKPNSPINKIVTCAPGWYTFPNPDIIFPYGLESSPVENLQLEQIFNKDFKIMIGSLDNDSNAPGLRHTEEAELQGANRLERAMSFFQYSQELSQSLVLSNSWTFEIVDGIGHDYASMAPLASDWLYSSLYSSCFYPFCSEIEGCTDLNAFNYDASADVDDGSCIDIIYGCMDITAFNYNSQANIDDGSCESVVYGCTDADAFNYNPLANIDNSSCIAIVFGCLNQLATNFNSAANTDDGSCLLPLTSNLSLQGILDFDLPSGGFDGKAIHLIANSDILDISVFGIGVANNGGGTDGQEESFPAISVSAGDQILFARTPLAMENYFGECYSNFDYIIQAGSGISQNGDDAIELYENNQVIETFGDINIDGTGEVWEYTDSWSYKLGDEWIYGGLNCTDDSETSISSTCPYPLCSIISVDQQEIYFNQGWNIFSTYINPENSSIEVLFNPIIDDLVIVKDYLGNAYLPQWSFNGIGNAQIGCGYYVKTTVSTSLTFYGAYLTPEENPITISSGWNIIGYLRTTPSPLEEIFESLVASDLIVIIKDYLGAAYLPEFDFNGIGDLNPGQGYQIKANGDFILQY